MARVAEAFLASGSGCSWVYVTPWRVTVAELAEALARALGKRRVLRLPVPRLLAARLGELRYATVQDRFRFTTRRSYATGLKWTSLEEALHRLAASAARLRLL